MTKEIAEMWAEICDGEAVGNSITTKWEVEVGNTHFMGPMYVRLQTPSECFNHAVSDWMERNGTLDGRCP